MSDIRLSHACCPNCNTAALLTASRMGDKGNGKEAKWAVERETDIWKWELLRKRNKGRGMDAGSWGQRIKTESSQLHWHLVDAQ